MIIQFIFQSFSSCKQWQVGELCRALGIDFLYQLLQKGIIIEYDLFRSMLKKNFSHGKALVTVDAEKAGRSSCRRNNELDDSNKIRCRWIRRELTTRSALITRGHNVNNIKLRSHIKRFFYLRDRFPLSFIDVHFYDSIYGYILFLYPRRGINILFFISMRFKAQMW